MPSTRLMFLAACAVLLAAASPEPATGTRPTDKSGRPLNFDFETGNLRDWTATGTAFQGQPVEGDVVAARRSDMKSKHQGRYWVGTYEKDSDPPQGTLTSVPFTLTKPFVRFLIAGGAHESSRVEIVRDDTKGVIFKVSGDDTEELKAVVADLSKHVGKDVFIRLVDNGSGGWGHINFDDLTLWSSSPPGPTRATSAAPDAFTHDGLPPNEAAEAMTVPPGFKVTLFAGEPDVVQPIAFAIDDRGRLWVCEAYSYPRRVPEKDARDRILIFEDKDGDGHFDTRKVFADKLNLVSGIELGFGGVWIGAAPNLLFIPDKDGDDKPDGPPQVLLDGWGYHDTHETLNSFIWGPDGWLYGCHGVFTHSLVGKPGTPEKDRTPLNAGIWRYHPTRHVFEVFAHGTSNPWGVDFDAHGQAFLTSCVIPHLYHVIQGARYERQAGPHFNPYTYDDIKTIADHRHYLGANPHAGNGRSDQAGGGHAHAGALIYQGNTWPEEYRGSLFMNNIHGARLNRDTLEPKGSGFAGHHAPDFLLANDRWSQIVSLKSGPDGNVYMIDWYDKNQCHRNETEVHDRTNGRIFKISYGDPAIARREATQPAPDMKARLEALKKGEDSSTSIALMFYARNDWHVRRARRQFQEFATTATDETFQHLIRVLQNHLRKYVNPDVNSLDFLWALHVAGGLDGPTLTRALAHGDPYQRAWAVQLACEKGTPSPAILAEFARLAKSDPSPIVRLYLASALQRLPLADRWPILEGLFSHAEDENDHNIPLMRWYAAEPLGEADPARALTLAMESKLLDLLPFMVRRVAALGTPESVALLVKLIHRTDSEAVRLTIVESLNESLKGRRQVDMPKEWTTIYPMLRDAKDARLRSLSTSLAVTFGDPASLKALRVVLADRKSEANARREALIALLKARDAELPATLVNLLDDPIVRGQALRGLAAFDDPKTADAVLAVYPMLAPDERRDALNTLAARIGSARGLLAAVGAGRIASKDLSADVVRQLRNLKDKVVDAQIGKVWGTARETSKDRAKIISSYRVMLTNKPMIVPDSELGRAVFAKTCQQCHTLFGVGAKIGPDLTGSNRADLDYVLSNVLDSSALIGKDYLAHIIATTDGRVLTGLIRNEDKDAITLQTANEVVVIPRGEVEAKRPSDQSMMPDDLWKPLSDHEVRSLVAYLASPAQVPMLATRDNVAAFFNGRDLTNWVGDPALWSVENGEIVGKTKGLAHNAFLRSDMSAGDFRLTVAVKLVANAGNSGIQFRSAALPDGEMKGDQADVGVGWWGKLYEENGRGLIWPKSGEAHVNNGEWNTYEVLAVGSRIRTRINGKTCVDLDDPPGARRGIFAFQLHSGGATEVHYKDIRLELDPKPED
jgi:putative membrane-bound dehydrogenase-like protein